MIASCSSGFFIKMTICHFPQFLCSMSVPPHSLTIHTAHRAPCVAPGRAVLLQGAGVYGRMYRRAAGCIGRQGDVLQDRDVLQGRGVLVTKHSLLAPASTTLRHAEGAHMRRSLDHMYEPHTYDYEWNIFQLLIHPMSVGITHSPHFRWTILFLDLNFTAPLGPSAPSRPLPQDRFPA